jgi:hypothetical protein
MKKMPFFGMCLLSSFVVDVNVRTGPCDVGDALETKW